MIPTEPTYTGIQRGLCDTNITETVYTFQGYCRVFVSHRMFQFDKIIIKYHAEAAHSSFGYLVSAVGDPNYHEGISRSISTADQQWLPVLGWL